MNKIITTGLVALWTLVAHAELTHFYTYVSGDFTTDLAGGADGTLFGNASLSSGALVTDGSAGTWSGNGPTTGMALPSSVATELGTEPFTFSYWIQLSATATYASEFAFSDGSTANWILGTPYAGNHNSASYVRVQGSGASYAATYDFMEVAAPPQAGGVLYHKVFVYDGSEAQLYIDGAVPNLSGYPPTASISGLNVATLPNVGLMGGSPWADNSANGTMFSFAIFDRALTQSEVEKLFAAGEDATMSKVKIAVGDAAQAKPALFIIK